MERKGRIETNIRIFEKLGFVTKTSILFDDYRDEKGQKYYPHSLNGSGLAIDRLIVALLEYYYIEKDNKLEIPAALRNHLKDNNI